MVSVIIPTHNRANLLLRAIKSVQEQTIKDLEIIVVSDGSTDDTADVMKKISNEDNRINYISYFPGHNGNYARNRGIMAAKGDYIAFLDDDDEWLPMKLEMQLEVMNSQPDVVLVYTGVKHIYVDEGVEYTSLPKKQGDLSKEILLGNWIGSTSTVLLRKEVLDKSGVFDEDLEARQDYDLWIRIAQYGNISAVIDPMINYYNYKSTKQVSSYTWKYVEASKKIDNKYKELFTKLNEEQRLYRWVRTNFTLGNKAMRNDDSKTARYYFTEILKKQLNKKALFFYVLSFTNYNTVLKFRRIFK